MVRDLSAGNPSLQIGRPIRIKNSIADLPLLIEAPIPLSEKALTDHTGRPSSSMTIRLAQSCVCSQAVCAHLYTSKNDGA